MPCVKWENIRDEWPERKLQQSLLILQPPSVISCKGLCFGLGHSLQQTLRLKMTDEQCH